jgi:hypothetical protein
MILEMRLRFIALSTFLLIGRRAAAQLATSPEANPIGTWRGTSHCVARATGCKDELIVYRIARKGRDSLSVDARKVGRTGSSHGPAGVRAQRAARVHHLRGREWEMAVEGAARQPRGTAASVGRHMVARCPRRPSERAAAA